MHVHAGPAAGEPLSFGAYLRQSRVLRELSLDEVARATKLPARIVGALEAGDFAAVGDRAYALLVVKSYATVIGLDPEETALRLEEELQARQPGASASGRRSRKLHWSLPREPVVWVVVVVTLLAIAAMFLFRR